MKHPVALAAVLMVTGCATISDSRFNPLNWFGRSTPVAVTAQEAELRPLVVAGDRTQVVDARNLIATVTDLQVDPTPTGAIVTARGVAATQGYFNAELVLRGVQNGTMTFDFKVETPGTAQSTGTVVSRQITAATSVSTSDLIGIRAIIVAAQANSLQSAR